MPQQENVGGVAHERANNDKISERANRKQAEPAGVEAMMLAR